MSQQARIQIEMEQKTEEGQPLRVQIVDENGHEVPVFLHLRSKDAVEQPFELSNSQSFYTERGGDFKGIFWWTAKDGKERRFESELKVPVPPRCPRCERLVPELVDYLCEDCRFG